MDKRWSYLLFLLWFFYLITTQVLLFTNGFLLSRLSLLNNSTCFTPGNHPSCNETEHCRDLLDGVRDASTTCLSPRSKVILLIVDAFRYDFALYNETLEHPLHYQNKLPVISSMRKMHPKHTRLFKFIADPPTTTMQRLKGLTTGSLPTFIDAGSNFATNEINEDNIIDQINSKGYKTVFMGDDTWDRLYPNRFLRNYPFPSFDVWDLDTVDYGVVKSLQDEMKRSDWDLLIGHFLGVDHCGHRYGPEHPEMKRKLTEINSVLKKVIDSMDENTTLFVIGDHGMTSTGDHGGDSVKEITAALFVHSKKELTSTYYEHNNTVKQVDLVPTLSTILGVPVPYSNLGSVIYDVLPVSTESGPNWHRSLYASWSNALQLTTYIDEYAKTSDSFDPEKLDKMHSRFHGLELKLPHVRDEHAFKNFALDVHDYVKSVRAMCEEVWIQFDAYSMARGLLLISHVTIFVYLIIEGFVNEKLDTLLSRNFILVCYASVLFGAFVSILLYRFGLVDNLLNMAYFVSGLSSVTVLGYVVIRNFQTIAENLYALGKSRKWPDIVSRIVVTFSAMMMFSNSFILEEAKVMVFFLLTLIFIVLLEITILRLSRGRDGGLKTFCTNTNVVSVLIICALIRFSTYFWRCREEQVCDNRMYGKDGYSARTNWAVTTVSLALFVTATRMWLRSCGNLNGYSITVLHARYMPTVTVVCSAGFWVLHQLPKDTKVGLLGPWQPDMLAWVVYVLTVTGVISVFVQPLSIHRLPTRSAVEVDTTSSNVIPQLARHVFTQQKQEKAPTVYGLATVYSASFVIVIVNLVLLWTLVLGDVVVPSCVALLFVAVFIVLITAILQYEKAQNITDLLEVPSTSLLLWFVVSIYMFYGTGHQPSFPSIAWEAAFVGTGGVLSYNIIPGTLVVLNTFGSLIITAVALPLLGLAPFSVYVMFPGLTKKNKLDLSKGDLNFYDHRQTASCNIFKLYCKYVMCHTIRMFCSMLSATIHCRHLMVWGIFAPKLIFEAVGLFVTLGSALCGYMLYMRIDSRVDKFITGLHKQFS